MYKSRPYTTQLCKEHTVFLVNLKCSSMFLEWAMSEEYIYIYCNEPLDSSSPNPPQWRMAPLIHVHNTWTQASKASPRYLRSALATMEPMPCRRLQGLHIVRTGNLQTTAKEWQPLVLVPEPDQPGLFTSCDLGNPSNSPFQKKPTEMRHSLERGRAPI